MGYECCIFISYYYTATSVLSYLTFSHLVSSFSSLLRICHSKLFNAVHSEKKQWQSSKHGSYCYAQILIITFRSSPRACKVNLAMIEKFCCYVCKMPLNDTWPRIWENSFLKRLRPFFSSCFCTAAMVLVLSKQQR